jgi:hypothetical protein
MCIVSSIVQAASTGAGLIAASIAVCGFIFHAGPALAGASEAELRQRTITGGLCGIAVSIFVILLSAYLG